MKWRPIVFYLFITVIITFPLIFYLRTHIYGRLGDSAAIMWRFWWQKYARLHQMDPNFSPMLAVPFGVNLADNWPKPLHYLVMSTASFLVNEIFAYNVVVLWSFFSGGLFAYFLFLEVTKNRFLGLILGAVYTLYPYHTVQMMGNLGPAQVHYLPLFFLFLLRLSKKKNFWNSFGLGLGFFLSTMEHFYYGYFLVVAALVFAVTRYLYLCWQKKRFFLDLRKGFFYFLASIIATLLLTIFCFNFVKAIFTTPLTESETFKFNFDNLVAGASRRWHYLLPSIHHPLWGKVLKEYIVTHFPTWTFHGAMDDQTLYLGWVNLIVVMIFLILIILQKLKAKFSIFNDQLSMNFQFSKSKINNFLTNERTFLIIFSIVLMATTIWFAGPPLKEVRGLNLTLTLPSFYVYKILPMFRQITRFGIITIISLMILLALALNFFLGLISNKKIKKLILSFYFILVVLDFTIIPPFRTFDVSIVPPVYQWLKDQPGSFLVMESPLALDWMAEFYQRIHQKPLVNGARTEESILWSKRHRNLTDPKVFEDLKKLEVKYVLVWPNKYNFLRSPRYDTPTSKNSDLVFVKKFEKVIVYEIR